MEGEIKMDVGKVDAIVVAFCGAGLLLSIYLGQSDLAQSIAVGLVGYLGGSAGKSVTEKKNEGKE